MRRLAHPGGRAARRFLDGDVFLDIVNRLPQGLDAGRTDIVKAQTVNQAHDAAPPAPASGFDELVLGGRYSAAAGSGLGATPSGVAGAKCWIRAMR